MNHDDGNFLLFGDGQFVVRGTSFAGNFGRATVGNTRNDSSASIRQCGSKSRLRLPDALLRLANARRRFCARTEVARSPIYFRCRYVRRAVARLPVCGLERTACRKKSALVGQLVPAARVELFAVSRHGGGLANPNPLLVGGQKIVGHCGGNCQRTVTHDA